MAPAISIPIENMSDSKAPDVIITSSSTTAAAKCDSSPPESGIKRPVPDAKGNPGNGVTQIVIQQGNPRPVPQSQGGILTLRNLVLAYAVLFLVVKAFQLGRDLKTAIDMVIMSSNSSSEFQVMLNQMTNKILWKSAYENASTSTEIQKLEQVTEAQVKSDVHVWNTYLAFHSFEYLYAWLLVFAVRNTVPLGIIAWLAFAAPTYSLYFIQVTTDMLLGDFCSRSLVSKAELATDIILQTAVILMALVYLKHITESAMTLANAMSLFQLNLKSSPPKADPVRIL